MDSSTPPKPSQAMGMHAHAQDSAMYLQDTEHAPQPAPYPASPESATVTEDDEGIVAESSDSGFDSGSLLGDGTDSLASSILNYRMENGRQYHAYRDGAYWGPNDELAKEILDFAHHMYLLTLDQKLHLAPLNNPQTILDCGTGTGIWAIVSTTPGSPCSPH